MNIDYSKITKNTRVIELLKQRTEIENYIKAIDETALIKHEIELLALPDVVSSKPDRKSLRQIIEERRTNLCLTASILKAGGKNETFFVGKYKLLDNILNEFDGIDEPN
jgi:hypothetical protein